MRSHSLTRLAKLLCLSTVVLGLLFASVSPVWAASNNNDVEWNGTGHYPILTICGDTSFPYRNPVNPRADQSVIIRARSYYQDLTGVTVWYTTNAGATEQSQWVPVTASWEANWWNCTGDPEWDMDIWRAMIPAQASQVWYKIAYTDGTDTDWQLAAGESSNGMYDDDGGWTTASTTLTYAPPNVVAVDDDFNSGTTGWYYNHFTSVQSGVSAVAAGGTVNVYSGSYTDNIVINKSLTLNGWDVANTIVIRPAASNPNCGGAGGGALCAGGSNLILVQANNVTIHNLTLDGDNPSLTSGIVRNGADLDARNGIIEDSASGVYGGLTVYDTTIRNIYLRGLSASSGGNNFNLHDNTVQNVQGDATNSVAIINEGGAGRIANNTISQAANAIVARNSRGTFMQYNTVTDSGRGVHTDNNGAAGGTYDVVEWNDVSNCTTGGHGIVVTAPWQDVSVHNNTVTRCAHGLSVDTRSAVAWPTFSYNSVDGQSLANSIGIYATTKQLGWGTYDVWASFDHNTIDNTATGIYAEQALITTSLYLSATHNTFNNSTFSLNMTGGNIFFFGNDVHTGSTALVQSGGFLAAYANNFVDYATAVNRTAGAASLSHNWWGTYTLQPAGVSNADWQARLGSVSLSSAVGNGGVTLGDASSTSTTGGVDLAFIVSHGRDLGNAPFGNATLNYQSLCSDYYDFFTITSITTWNVSLPVDNSPACITQTLEPGRIFWIPAATNYLADCTPYDNTSCWDLITTNVITGGQNITVTGLSMADLGGTQFVAGSTTGTDPTAVTIVGLAATTDRSAAPAGILLAGAVIAAAGIVLVTRRRR